jgi:FlaA1/EpsC-like NDP-sugar epimerase
MFPNAVMVTPDMSDTVSPSFARLLRLGRTEKRLLQMCADSVLVIVCFGAAMALRLESFAFLGNSSVWLMALICVPATILVFFAFGLYRSILRFISGQVLRAIGCGVIFSAAFLFLLAALLSAPLPRSVPGIYALLLFVSAGGLRFVARAMFQSLAKSARIPVAIYGAGEAGRQLKDALQNGRDYLPLAFFDDDPTLHGAVISGRTVFAPDQIAQVVEDMGVASILLAVPSASRLRRREIVEEVGKLGLQVKTIPGIADIVSGRATVSELRQISPEDLLGRDAVPPREDLMQRNITGKVVMVTGAGGSIGSELCRQIVQFAPAEIILFELSEFALYSITHELRETLSVSGREATVRGVLGSVQNARRVRDVMKSFGVQTVYHAAAYKHVVLVEENVTEGIRNNVFGTLVLAEAAADLGVESFILISTDKAVRPTNFMGASKRMAELVCQAFAQRKGHTTFSMVRFGNVLGSSGSVLPRFRSQIEKGGPVTVTHPDITRYFMTIPEAAQLVIQAGAMARGGDVFVLDMGDPVKILDLAESMIRLHGLKPYLLQEDGSNDKLSGDIGIRFVGLNKGEKLFEELLIGENPMPTAHPRIMTATEMSLPWSKLHPMLQNLNAACLDFDLEMIKVIFLEAPLAFKPSGNAIHDLTWLARGTIETAQPLPSQTAVAARIAL